MLLFVSIAFQVFLTSVAQRVEHGSHGLDTRDIVLVELIQQHILLCGYDYICNITKFPELASPSPVNQYNITGSCPDCYCDDSCVSRGDCCPDVYFALPPSTCTTVTLLHQLIGIEPKPPSYDIVSSCPAGSKSTEQNLCGKTYSLTELLTRPPVAANDLPVSFKNKHCAKCNGVYNTTDWILDIDCILFADFNFLSTYQEIIDLAIERKCRIRFAPMDIPARTCNLTLSLEEKQSTRLCNTSGTWKTYDHNIKLACESSYNLKFRKYKNVFCYMCNPPKHLDSDVIGRCNVTGMWHPYDGGLALACLHHPTSQSTFPFKNIFCYLCNRITSDKNIFYDVIADLSEDILNIKGSVQYTYVLATTAFRQEYLRFLYITTPIRNPGPNVNPIGNGTVTAIQVPSKPYPDLDSQNSFIVQKKDFSLNITNLIYKMFALRPADQFCFKNLVPLEYVLVHFPICDCNPRCLFTEGFLCCLDFALSYPVSCVNSIIQDPIQKHVNSKQFLVTDGCWKDAGHFAIRQNCEAVDQTDSVSFLPLIDNITNTYYKNFHCFLCNKNVQKLCPTDDIELVVKMQYNPFTVYIACLDILDFSHSVASMDVINIAKFLNCSISIDEKIIPKTKIFEPKPRVSCSGNHNFTGKCNVTGNWPMYDPDVAWACEQTAGNQLPFYNNFKNYYCYLCNPQFEVTDVITACNVTGRWKKYNINHERACHLFPRIYSYPIYKNIFCELCNSESIGSILPDRLGHSSRFSDKGEIGPHMPYRPTYRSLFSVAEYDDIEAMEGEICRKDQIFDYQKNLCRNTTCFPGKVFSNNTCIPLLTVTNNLRYSISLEFTGKVTEDDINALNYLLLVEKGIHLHLTDLLQTSEYQFDNFHLLSNFPCSHQSETILVDTVRFDLYMTISIHGYVPRLVTEATLLDHASNIWNFSISNGTISLLVRPSLTALRTPSYIQKASFKETCFIQRFNQTSFVPLQTIRSVFVSRILLCKQIELDPDEYTIDVLTMDMSISAIRKTMYFDQYQKSSAGKIRVCVDDVESLSYPFYTSNYITLSIVTLVCALISLVCLFFTFVVYLLCPSLWSVPGLNNMCLVISLFFTQIAFLFGNKARIDSVLCNIIGVVSHFLWLTSFSWMTICSFHMFSVFCGIGIYHRVKNKTQTQIQYIIYSVSIPFVIVGLNILFSLGLNEGQTIGYGEYRCFISTKVSFIITFLVPIIITCLLNVVFFSITAHNIRISPSVESNKENRRHFSIYVKLFILTGVMWLLTVTEAFFPLSIASYLTTILNGCQGVFIFISYVLNKRVFALLKDRYTKSTHSFGKLNSNSQQTASTSLDMKLSPSADR